MPNEEQESSQALGYDRSKVAEAMLGIRQGQEGGPVDISVTPQTLAQPITQEQPVVAAPVEVRPEAVQEQLEQEIVDDLAPQPSDDGSQNVDDQPAADDDQGVRELDEYDVVGVLQEAGISVNSFKEITEALQLRDQYKTTQKEFSGLSEDEKRRIAVARKFGDPNLYDRVTSVNADVLPEKEILRQIYFLENSGKSIDFLSKQFERNYKKDYETIEEEEDQDFIRLKLQEDAREAREKMKAFQDVLKAETLGGAETQETPDDTEERNQAWRGSVDYVLDNADRVAYSIGETEISIPMDPASRDIIQNAMYDPIRFIMEAISDDNGNTDHEALFEFIMRNVNFEKILAEAKNTGRANFQETQLRQLRNAEPPKTSTKMEAPVVETARDQFAKFAANRRNV